MSYDFENKRRLTNPQKSKLSTKDFWEYERDEALDDIKNLEEKVKLCNRTLASLLA